MQDYVKLISLDECFEESRLIQKDGVTIDGFDYMGKFWPLYEGRTYLVELEL